MANTFTQIHLQIVVAVKNRAGLISSDWESRLYEYMVAIIQNHSHKVLAINGMPDHVHILIGLRPNQSLSELMQILKASSSKWINEEKLTKSRFAWQEGYGAFSYTKSDVPKVVNYILKQKEHHRKSNFLEEYRRILDKLEIDYNPLYVFKEPE
ncbi:MAG: IS200/IS605 family transposase [Cytophagales bacterium]|nr:MAG: IS200/IS605 family transposase [Cytophagales bacterium]